MSWEDEHRDAVRRERMHRIYTDTIAIGTLIADKDYNFGELESLLIALNRDLTLRPFSFPGGHIGAPAQILNDRLDRIEEVTFLRPAPCPADSSFFGPPARKPLSASSVIATTSA